MLGRSRTTPLPTNIPASELPQKFCDFFTDKIAHIRSELDKHQCEPPVFSAYNGPVFSEFKIVSEKEILDLITSLPPKSCSLDPIPTKLTKECLSELVPLITAIVNSSLSTVHFHHSLRERLYIRF